MTLTPNTCAKKGGSARSLHCLIVDGVILQLVQVLINREYIDQHVISIESIDSQSTRAGEDESISDPLADRRTLGCGGLRGRRRLFEAAVEDRARDREQEGPHQPGTGIQ